MIGATSDIGRALARRLADLGYALQLTAREAEQAEREARDLRVRAETPVQEKSAVTTYRCDVLDADGGVSLLDTLDPLPDVAVCVVGLLGDHAESKRNTTAAQRVMRTNYIGPAFAARGAGQSGLRSAAAAFWWASALSPASGGVPRTMFTARPRPGSPRFCPGCGAGWRTPGSMS